MRHFHETRLSISGQLSHSPFVQLPLIQDIQNGTSSGSIVHVTEACYFFRLDVFTLNDRKTDKINDSFRTIVPGCFT